MDFRSIISWVNPRDVVLDAVRQQRPLLVDPEQVQQQLLESLARMAGHSTGQTDDGFSAADQPEPGSALPGNLILPVDVAHPGTTLGPSAGFIDDAVLRIPPGSDPLQVQPGLAIPLPDRISGDRPAANPIPLSAVLAPAIARPSDRPASSNIVPEEAQGASSAAASAT